MTNFQPTKKKTLDFSKKKIRTVKNVDYVDFLNKKKIRKCLFYYVY